jgi:hypothetical protein
MTAAIAKDTDSARATELRVVQEKVVDAGCVLVIVPLKQK